LKGFRLARKGVTGIRMGVKIRKILVKKKKKKKNRGRETKNSIRNTTLFVNSLYSSRVADFPSRLVTLVSTGITERQRKDGQDKGESDHFSEHGRKWVANGESEKNPD